MIADQDGRFHGFCRNLRGLRNVGRENQNEDDREGQAFDPLAKWPFAARRERIERWSVLRDERRVGRKTTNSIEPYIWNVMIILPENSEFFDHLRKLFLYQSG